MTVEIDDPVLLEFAAEVGNEDEIVVRGGGTKWTVGGTPHPGAREIRAPAGIVDLRPEEMVVHVRAATPLSELHAALAEVGQRTALPEEPRATVGGTLAVGRSSLARLGRGQARDAALQIRYVAADGALVTAGGPTVKNVSGFDLCRLQVGSLGTLGCIGDVILRTIPMPEREAWFRFDDFDPDEIAPGEIARDARTAASVLWNGTTVWALLAGYEIDVETDLTMLARFGPTAAAGPPDLPPHRWSLRPSEIESLAGTGEFIAEMGVGIVHAEQPVHRLPLAADVLALHARVKRAFDPTGRLNPGRTAESR